MADIGEFTANQAIDIERVKS